MASPSMTAGVGGSDRVDEINRERAAIAEELLAMDREKLNRRKAQRGDFQSVSQYSQEMEDLAEKYGARSPELQRQLDARPAPPGTNEQIQRIRDTQAAMVAAGKSEEADARAKAEEDAARSAAEFSKYVTVAAAAAAMFAAGVNSAATSMAQSSKDADKLITRVGQNAASLGMAPTQVAELQRNLTSNVSLPGGTTRDDVAQLFETFNQSKGMLPSSAVDKAGVMRVIMSDLPMQEKMRIASSPGSVVTASWMLDYYKSQRATTSGRTASALQRTSRLDAIEWSGKGEGEETGQTIRNIDAFVQRKLDSGDIGYHILDKLGLARPEALIESGRNRILGGLKNIFTGGQSSPTPVKVINNVPPSGTEGREGK